MHVETKGAELGGDLLKTHGMLVAEANLQCLLADLVPVSSIRERGGDQHLLTAS